MCTGLEPEMTLLLQLLHALGWIQPEVQIDLRALGELDTGALSHSTG